jgi:hypothetical protein
MPGVEILVRRHRVRAEPFDQHVQGPHGLLAELSGAAIERSNAVLVIPDVVQGEQNVLLDEIQIFLVIFRKGRRGRALGVVLGHGRHAGHVLCGLGLVVGKARSHVARVAMDERIGDQGIEILQAGIDRAYLQGVIRDLGADMLKLSQVLEGAPLIEGNARHQNKDQAETHDKTNADLHVTDTHIQHSPRK